MDVYWPWRPVPELRDLPRAEQKRIWRRCLGRAMLSWRFAASMAAGFLCVATIGCTYIVAMTYRRESFRHLAWLDAIAGVMYVVLFAGGMILTMQPWMRETRRRIRSEREQSDVS
jgi:hypothetical protein